MESLIKCGANVNAVDVVSYYVATCLPPYVIFFVLNKCVEKMDSITSRCNHGSQFNSGEFDKIWSKC